MNMYFDCVLAINLARRPDRWEQLQRELRRAEWPFRWPERIEAIDYLDAAPPGLAMNPRAWGATRTHARALEHAIRSRARRVLVLEDDCVFCRDFAPRALAFLAAAPRGWNCLMLGYDARQGRTSSVAPGVVRVEDAITTHAYALERFALRRVWRAFCVEEEYPDIILRRFHRTIRSYGPQPPLVGQAAGHSDVDAAHPEKPESFFTAAEVR